MSKKQNLLWLIAATVFVIIVTVYSTSSANDKKCADSAQQIINRMTGTDISVGCNDLYIDHFDTGSSKALFGKGARNYIAADSTILANIPVHPKGDQQLYEFSCWTLLDTKDYKSPYFHIEYLDKDGKTQGSVDALGKHSVDNKGMWFRCSAYLYVKSNVTALKVTLINPDGLSYLSFDEMVLRPADGLVISKAADGSVMVNNHLVKDAKK